MTVAVQDPINQFVISSLAQTTGPWSWQLNQETDLTVFKLSFDTGLITTLVLDTDYTVNSADLGNKLGGTITFLAAQIPPVIGDIWTLQRNTELSRNQDFATSGDFQAVTVNPQFDDPILIAQDTQRDAQNALRKDPAVGDTLNPLIPQPIVGRGLVFSEPTPGNFEFEMTDDDINSSASDAAASAAAAAASEASAEEDANNAAESAAEAAQSAGLTRGLYQINRIAGPYIGDNFVTSGESAEPESVTFSTDGLTMFIVDSGTRTIYQYSLTHPFNLHLENVEYTGLFVDVGADGLTNPQDMKFNTDGTKMFVLDDFPGADITEYNLQFGFSFAGTVVDSGNAFVVSGEEGAPTGFTFSPNGFLMFLVGNSNIPPEVNRYTLTTAFSMAGGNVTPDGVFSIGTNIVPTPQSIAFNPDGSKMFILDAAGPTLEFNLTILFSFSATPQFTGNEFDTQSVDDSPTGLIFSQDGSKLFIAGQELSAAYEYIMSTPFLLPHGVEFSGESFSVLNQTNQPRGITFNDDGTRMYVSSAAAPDTIFQYDLTLPYSMEAGNVFFLGISFVPSASEVTVIRDMVFNADGSRMFILDEASATGYEYTISIPYDLGSTVTYTTLSFDFSNEDVAPKSIAFGQNGFKLFIAGDQFDTVQEYNLVVPFSFAATNVTFSGNTFNATGELQNIEAVRFSEDGFLMFLLGDDAIHSQSTIYQYDLVASFSLTQNAAGVIFNGAFFGVNGQDTLAHNFVFNSDGSKFFVAGNANNSIFEYDLTFPFRINQFVYPVEDDENGLLLQVGTTLGDVEIILPDSADLLANFRVGIVKVSDDANKIIVRHQGVDAINIEEESIDIEALDKVVGFFLDIEEPNWIADIGEVSTALYNENQLIDTASIGAIPTGFSFISSGDDNLPTDMAFNTDGTKIFILGDQNNTVFQYDLTVPFSLEFGVTGPTQSFSVASEETAPTGITWSNTGTLMMITGTSPVVGNVKVFQYAVTTPFDLQAGQVTLIHTFDVSAQAPAPAAIKFNGNGKRMFVLDSSSATLFQYTLSIAFLFASPPVFSGFSHDFTPDETDPIGFDFSNNGRTIFLVGITNVVREFSLTNGFNLQIAPVFTGQSFLLLGTGTESVTFKKSGETPGDKFFIMDDVTGGVVSYNLSVPFDLGDNFAVTRQQNGFLFTADTTASELGIILPDSSLLNEDFRFGVVKISGDANLITASVQGTDTVNGGTSVSFSIQNKVTLISLDRATGNWTADLGQLEFPAFRGCLVNLTGAIVIPDSTNTELPWTAEAYDTNDIHDNSVNNSRLTVPPGITRVRLSARFRWDNNATGIRRITITKNGSFNWVVGIGQEEFPANSGINISSSMTAVAIVTPGDFFEVSAQQTSGGNLNVQQSVAWFQMEILE